MISVILVQTGGDGLSHAFDVEPGTNVREFLRDCATETGEKFSVTLVRGGTVYSQGENQVHQLLDDMALADCDKITTMPKNVIGAD